MNLTGAFRPCSSFTVCSDRLYCLFAVRSHRVFRACGQVVHGDEDAEEDEDADARERSVARVSLPEVGDDLAPLSDRVEHDERQTGPGGVDRRTDPTPASET